MEYSFIPITPRSILTRSGSTRSGLINESNKTAQAFTKEYDYELLETIRLSEKKKIGINLQYLILHNLVQKRKRRHKKKKKKKLNNTKAININVQWTLLPNLLV